MVRHSCQNCSEIFTGNFCPNCGQSAHEHRIDAHYFLHDIPHSVFHIDGGFFYTLKMLFTQPGVMIADFLEGRRARHFRPFAYVMVMTALSAFLVKFFDWAKLKLLEGKGQVHTGHENFFEHYFSFFIFLMIPIATVVTWIAFRRKEYNYWEHFLANTYLAAQLNILWVLLHFAGMTGALLFGHDATVEGTYFLIFFLMFFLYLYGATFGFLMRNDYKIPVLVTILTLMNMVLATVYSFAFNLAGLVH